MTLTLELTPDEEARLALLARSQGLNVAEVAHRLLSEQLRADANGSPEEDPALALFARWDAEDSTMTAEDVAQENREWESFKTSINAERDRAGARRVF